MNIKTVYATNVLGMSWRHALGSVTLICGGNGHGKTAITKGLKLALTECLPPGPGKSDPVKSGQGIYRLAGDPENAGEMVVGIETDGGRRHELKYARDAKGKVSSSGSVPADLRCPAMLFDASNFFACTGAEQVKAVFDACDPSAIHYGADNIRQRLAEIDVKPAATCEAIKDEIDRVLAREFRAEVPPQLATGHLLEWLSNETRQAKSEAQRHSGAFAAFRSGLQQTGRVVDVSAELAEKRRMLVAAQTRSEDAASAAFERLAAIGREFEEMATRCCMVFGPTDKMQEMLIKRIDAAQTQIEHLKDPGAVPDIDDDLAELESEITQTGARLQENQEAQAALNGRLSAVAEYKLCKKCREKIVGPCKKQLAALVEQHATLAKEQDGYERRAKDMIDARSAKQTARGEYDKSFSALSAELKQLQTELATLEALLKERLALEAKIEGASAAPKDDTQALEAQIHDLEAKDRAWTNHRKDMERRDDLEGKLLMADCRTETLKAVTKIVVEEQAKATESAFSKILESARAFTDGILPSPLEFRKGELGRRATDRDVERGCKAGSWMFFEHFSDSEKRLTLPAFAVALARMSPVKLVIIDELATFERPYLVVERLVELQARGVIDQAVLVCPGQPTWLNGLANQVKVISL